MPQKKHLISIILIAIASHFFAACDEGNQSTGRAEPATSSGEPVLSWPATRATAEGGFEITLNPSNGEIEENKHFTLDVTVNSTKGELKHLTVKVDGDMPAHGHGMNTKPEGTPLSSASYRVEGMLFHMGGDWVITADVECDGKTERALFPITIQ